jgi:hypothetical protein
MANNIEKSVVKELVARRCKKMQQEFVGENEEIMDRLLRQFQSKITRCSWKATQKWCKWNNEGPVLMPDYTRIYYRKGDTEVLVQEWPPQIRLTKFRASLVLRDDSASPVPEGDMLKVFNFSLAYPYVVFIFRFRQGKFVDVRCAFNDRPLKRLEEKPLRPYLSNLDSNLLVCLGRSFDHSKLEVGNIVQQAAYITSYFWQSVYSDEWSQHYWNSKRHFMSVDPRMATLEAWQNASSENPLFVVEDVQWLPHAEESFGDIIVRLFDDDKSSAEMGQELYQEFINEFMQEVKTTMSNNMNTVSNRVGNMDDNQLNQEINTILGEQNS